MSWFDSLQADLDRRRTEHLYRARRVIDATTGAEVQVGGRTLVNLCSNDYLGLAGDARLAEAMVAGVRRYGVGAGAAHLVTGHSRAHHELEEELAAFTGRQRALLFSTGYMANIGVVSALLGRGDHCFEDRLNHASLIDAGLLSRAGLRRYAHGDAAALEVLLGAADKGRRLVVTDGVFSMDGDLAPLPALAEACARHDAWLMVDDAHGLGVLGTNGAGTLEHCGLGAAQAPVLMGTLGKALGTSGAFVAGDEVLIETLIQHARTYVYTTAAAPAVAEATRAALRIVREEPWRRERLQALVARFRREALAMGLPLMESETPIQPIVAGTAERALAWSRALEGRGLLVGAIRPPTVPEGSARLRITFSATHTDEHLDRLLEGLSGLVLDEGVALA